MKEIFIKFEKKIYRIWTELVKFEKKIKKDLLYNYDLLIIIKSL